MASRERTREFSKYRQQVRIKSVRRRGQTSPGEGKSLMSDAATTQWEEARHALPPLYVDAVDEINEVIDRIHAKISELNKLHTDRLMVKFDDSEQQAEAEIERKTREITQQFREAEKILQRVASGPMHELDDSEIRVRTNIQRSLATKLQNLSSEFRKSQKEYLGRVRKEKQEHGDFAFLDKGEKTKTFDPGFTQMQMEAVKYSEDLVNERDQEILHIAKSIEELAQIFKELAVLVIDQGTILDRIDYNMEQVVDRTKTGLKELQTAERYQKSSRPLKCIMILVTLIIIMLGILILKHT